jgi:hypothetical protein
MRFEGSERMGDPKYYVVKKKIIRRGMKDIQIKNIMAEMVSW